MEEASPPPSMGSDPVRGLTPPVLGLTPLISPRPMKNPPSAMADSKRRRSISIERIESYPYAESRRHVFVHHTLRVLQNQGDQLKLAVAVVRVHGLAPWRGESAKALRRPLQL